MRVAGPHPADGARHERHGAQLVVNLGHAMNAVNAVSLRMILHLRSSTRAAFGTRAAAFSSRSHRARAQASERKLLATRFNLRIDFECAKRELIAARDRHA